jgi:hypothetical protein
LEQGFLATDHNFLNECIENDRMRDAGSGGTIFLFQGQFTLASALVAYITDTTIFVASAGTCSAILGRRYGERSHNDSFTMLEDGTLEAIPLAQEHTVFNEKEEQRLMEEHPKEPDIVYNGMIKGMKRTTRGIGDGPWKSSLFNNRGMAYVIESTYLPFF